MKAFCRGGAVVGGDSPGAGGGGGGKGVDITKKQPPQSQKHQQQQQACEIVEVGAGLGYWAMMLRAAGCVVRAYDKRLACNNHNSRSSSGGGGGGGNGGMTNEYHGRFATWSEVGRLAGG